MPGPYALRAVPGERYRVEGTPHFVTVFAFTLAREARGHTRREAAAELGLTLHRLRAVERGTHKITRDELARFAAFYEFPESFFAQQHDLLGFPDPIFIFICGDWYKQTPPCSRCGAFSEFLCDWPMGRGKTCDLALCGKCRVRVAGEWDEDDDPAGIDYCPQHAQMAVAGQTEDTNERDCLRRAAGRTTLDVS